MAQHHHNATDGGRLTAPAVETAAGAPAVPAAAPQLDVRVVLFAIADGALLIALAGAPGAARLPRGLPNPSELLDVSARRIAREATGRREQYLEQLYTLSVEEQRRWAVIVSYMGLVGADQTAGPGPGTTTWHPVTAVPLLSDADHMVVEYALLRLRAKLGYTNIAFHLLPGTFTLSELQRAYETILGHPLDKRNFRRRVIASGLLEPTTGRRREGSHRPAALYRFRAEQDTANYLTPRWADAETR